MPVQPSEVQLYLSNPNATTGFSGIGIPGNSNGKFMAVNQLQSQAPLDDLFLDLSAQQNASLQVDYQCLFLMNNTVTGLSMNSIYVWFPQNFWTSGGAGIALGVDPTGKVPYNTAVPQAVTIPTVLTAPSGVTTWYPGPHATFSAGLPLQSLQPQQVVAIWIQRTATNCPPLTPQSMQLEVTYQSAA